jgi:hypothetical protein
MIDPYGIKQGDTAWDIGNYANTWEVTVLPTVDKSKEYAALYPQLRLDRLHFLWRPFQSDLSLILL